MSDVHYSLAGKRVWVAGHNGMVGSAIVRRLQITNCEIVTVSRSELDLTRQSDVEVWLAETKPDAIIMAAAHVGGILANDAFPVEFLVHNTQIETNIFAAAHAVDINRMLFLDPAAFIPGWPPSRCGKRRY